MLLFVLRCRLNLCVALAFFAIRQLGKLYSFLQCGQRQLQQALHQFSNTIAQAVRYGAVRLQRSCNAQTFRSLQSLNQCALLALHSGAGM
jgi:hypothetical protein